jgi:hypothetical protein
MQRKPYLLAFDTEDDSHGTPFLFCAVHERGSYHTADRSEFLFYLRELATRQWNAGRQLEAWATNLEYDLVNLFGPERIAECSLRFGASYLVTARWKRVHFRDTVRHLPLSVKELGKLVGLPKLRRSSSVAYCLRDTTITYRTARFLHETFKRLRVRPRNTLAATAYALWSERFFDREVRSAPGEIVKAAREAYHGGRTEVFRPGMSGRVRVIDANSMFPWAMISDELPVPWGPYRKARLDDEAHPLGLYRVLVRSDIAVPILPVRMEDGTAYPNGAWQAWITGPEVLYCRARGVDVRIMGGFHFLEACRPFDSYIARMFQLKNQSRGPTRLMYKLLLNSLYGKFGQKGGRIIFQKLRDYERRPDPPLARIWNGLAVYRVESKAPPWGNVVWAAFVTARARIRLHREIERIRERGGTVLYCDTDSVFYTGARVRYPARAEKPGEFESRGTFRSVLIVGKKEYMIETRKGSWTAHAKGIPASVRREYLETGRASFQRPTKLRESVRTGDTPNGWKTRTKVRHASFNKRSRNVDGTLRPIVYREGRLFPRGRRKASHGKVA